MKTKTKIMIADIHNRYEIGDRIKTIYNTSGTIIKIDLNDPSEYLVKWDHLGEGVFYEILENEISAISGSEIELNEVQKND